MSAPEEHEVQILSSSLEEIQHLLSAETSPIAGASIRLGDGAGLRVTEISKSSGFDATTLIVTGVVTLVTGVTKDVLVEWFKARMKKGTSSQPVTQVTVIIDGKELRSDPHPQS